jgi:hypothetical protein
LKYLHFIPHTRRYDFTEKALLSSRALAERTVVIDNSEGCEAFSLKEKYRFAYHIPSVPLTTAQTMNLMRQRAIEAGCDFFIFQHNDAELHENTPVDLLLKVHSLINSGEKWGAVFTHYDTFAAFNVQAVKDIGEWDWLRFPFYFLDNDYYKRLRDGGWPIIETELGVTHHASNTINADPERKQVSDAFFPVCRQLYILKHGEEP